MERKEREEGVETVTKAGEMGAKMERETETDRERERERGGTDR